MPLDPPTMVNIEIRCNIFPLSTITLVVLISGTKDSDSTVYYRISQQLLALSVSDVQSLLVINH